MAKYLLEYDSIGIAGVILMARIDILPPEVVDQIAAGEVVERPSHMVKELVENSIDAGASQIEVEFEQGGRFVRITDNGGGIAGVDLPKAFARHATSKIHKTDDIWKLRTFGFRGEALASISAVSRVTLISREPASDEGNQLVSDFGVLGAPEVCGANVGTTIRVEALFENVPARLKFLKSETAESTQIKSTLKAMALIHPGVEFRIRTQGKLLDVWGRADDLQSRAEQVLGVKPLFSHQSVFESKEGPYRCECVFASPHEVTGTSKQIWIFVQNRWVQDRGLQAAVIDAYRGLLMHGEFPVVVVRLDVPFDEIDVNIHPTKSQVKFRDPQSAFRAVHRCLREGLEKAPWLSAKQLLENQLAHNSQMQGANFGVKRAHEMQVKSPEQEYQQAMFSRGVSSESTRRTESEFDRVQIRVKQDLMPTMEQMMSSAAQRMDFHGAVVSEDSSVGLNGQGHDLETRFDSNSSSTSEKFWSRLHVLGQAHLTYILAQSETHLYLIDQHAAHERVAYERLMQGWKAGAIEVQDFLIPLTVDLETEQVEALLGCAEEFQKMGVQIDGLSPTAIALRSCPAGLSESAVLKSLETTAREILQKGGSFAFEKKIGDIFATMACHSVVRAGQALSLEQMRSLLQQMDEFALSSFCPHGRPVSIDYPFSKIERDFGRIV